MGHIDIFPFGIPYFVRKMIVNKECIKSNKGEHYQIKINLSKHEIQSWLFFHGEIIIGVYCISNKII